MKLKALILIVLMAALCTVAWAGDIEGKVTGMKGHSVVYVDTIAGKTFPAPKEHPVMDQKGLMFAPHIIVVQQGTTVEFLNSDSVQHNVFWTAIGNDKKAGHNLGTWPKGEKRPFTFDKAGVVPLLCNVHPEMAAYIIVSPTPYFRRDRRCWQLQNQGRSRRQLHAYRVARGREESVEAGDRFRRRQSGFHPEQVRSRKRGATEPVRAGFAPRVPFVSQRSNSSRYSVESSPARNGPQC